MWSRAESSQLQSGELPSLRGLLRVVPSLEGSTTEVTVARAVGVRAVPTKGPSTEQSATGWCFDLFLLGAVYGSSLS